MKTDDLITLLATGAGSVDHRATRRRLPVAVTISVLVAITWMAAWLRVRPDIAQAVELPMFWIKLAFPATVAAIAGVALARLSRPGLEVGRGPLALLLAVVAVIWLMAIAALAGTPTDERINMVLGATWQTCTRNVMLLALPVFIAMFAVLKTMAPTRLAQAGAAAGLLAGAAGAAVYALHCPEMDAPFIAVWYVLGMAVPAALGTLIGPRLLRW